MNVRRFFASVMDLIGSILGAVNLWGGLGVIGLVGFPILVAILAGSGYDWKYIYVVGAVPVLFGFAVFAAIPVVFWFMSLVGLGRKTIGSLSKALLIEVLWTLYCAVVPVENSKELFAFVMALWLVIFLASFPVERWAHYVKSGAGILIFIMTAVFFTPAELATWTSAKPGTAKHELRQAAIGVKDLVVWANKKPEPDFWKVYPGQTLEIPFVAGVETKMIQVAAFVRSDSGMKVRYDVDVSVPCVERFTERLPGAPPTQFVDAPGLVVDYGVRTGNFYITGVTDGVAKVSVWLEPQN